ncbi:STAS/SEC14 domain-containing protein [Planctomycetota bacterium]
MAVKLHNELNDHVATFHATGKLTKQDYHHFTRIVDRLIKEHGFIRIIFEIKNFQGWMPEAIWDNIKINIRHFCHIERLAMVGNTQWERGMCLFCKPFSATQIRYFHEYEAGKAQTWIHAESDTDKTEPLSMSQG